jgi:cation-transporting ATPase E
VAVSAELTPTPADGFVTPPEGLDAAAVRDRIDRGLVNAVGERTSRTIVEIVRANVLTRFNAILGTMLVLILAFGHLQDALFGIVLVTNALIGIVQEIRAKRTLDRLAVLNAPRARIVRDGTVREVAVEEVVLDDLVELRTGDQVPADGVVRSAAGLEIDESLLTGESDPVDKAPDGDAEVLSGSIVVAGTGRFQATRIGADAYARSLAREARRFTLVRSELMDGINLILKYITWAILVVGPLLFWSQLRDDDTNFGESVTAAVAGVVGMVPEGLVLLTSIAFGVAAVTLARRQVLVQELPAVEGLARVDVVCLDKTGTLTEGIVEFDGFEVLGEVDDETVRAALGALADDENANATLAAVRAACPPPAGWERGDVVAFSSARKWSAADFGPQGSWVIGAPEMVWPVADDRVRVRADSLAADGNRVLLLARSGSRLTGEALPPGLEPVALVTLEEKVRPDAADTLAYFAAQGVTLRVISGDNPRTVGAIAERVGLPDAGRPLDARELPEDPGELAEVLERHSVYGRVTPHQKRAMVSALQSRGHVVAMTGDGVNDALALKDADIGVAMGSGAAATRAVAQLVLLDGRFATLPGVVAEGRRVTANIERVANLFLTKTTYATLLAFAVAVASWPYPFLPRHLTVVSSLTIGIPAFFLALAPNARRYQPGFVPRVLRLAVPAGTIAAGAVFVAYAGARAQDVTVREARTLATIVLFAAGMWVLVILARPFTRARALLVASMVALFGLAFAIPAARRFYALRLPPSDVLVEGLVVAGLAVLALELFYRYMRRIGRAPAPTERPSPGPPGSARSSPVAGRTGTGRS